MFFFGTKKILLRDYQKSISNAVSDRKKSSNEHLDYFCEFQLDYTRFASEPSEPIIYVEKVEKDSV